MNYKKLKLLIYACGRALGLFRLSFLLTQNKLRILAYHGFSITDEHLFLPSLFITKATLEKRLNYLRKLGIQTIPFDKAFLGLKSNQLPPKSAVITIDDGFYSTLSVADPIFAARNISFTLYITTYYVTHPFPIFGLTVRYILWVNKVDENQLIEHFNISHYPLIQIRKYSWIEFITYAKNEFSEELKQQIIIDIANHFNFNYDKFLKLRQFSLLNANEIVELQKTNHEFGLHTHRHQVSDESDPTQIELKKNQEILQTILNEKLFHFCYPNGHFTDTVIKYLIDFKIQSATTCIPGLADYQTNIYKIPRFLDGENIHQLEFEAEISGFADILRNFSKRKSARNFHV